MRDPNRIDRIQNKITELWKYYPDMRYLQLVEWIRNEASDGFKDNEHYLFYMEDNVLELLIDDMIRTAQARKALRELNKEEK